MRNKKENTQKQDYICPNCKSEDFKISSSVYQCAECSKIYKIHEGIPVFREGDAHFHWGVLSEKMQDMIKTTRKIGWHDAMMNFLSVLSLKEAILVWNRTFGPRRLAMTMLLPLNKKARVLDIGSGWGTISMNLTRYCDFLVSMDQIYHHLEWQKLACKNRGIRNITFVQSGDTRYLPFPSASFDIVILNGVLEWVASNMDGNPSKVQEQFLKEIRRILTQRGILYIGIENRWNYKYFKGIPEGHINMKFGALLPRFLTDLYLRMTRSMPFREYTYTLFGYRRLLKDAGLSSRQFYAALPHYSSIISLLPLEKEGDKVLKQWNINTSDFFVRRPWSYLSRSYVMTAGPNSPAQNIMSKIISHVISKMQWPCPVTFNDTLFRVTSTGKAVAKLSTDKGTFFFLSVALFQESGKGLQNQYAALSRLFKENLKKRIRKKLPRSILFGEIDGFFYTLNPFYQGCNGGVVLLEKNKRTQLCKDAFDFLIDLSNKLGKKLTISDDLFQEYFFKPLSSIRNWFTKKEWDIYESWSLEVASRIRNSLLGKDIVITPRHGDFVPENCLVDDYGRLKKVLDWEMCEDRGLPLYDWITFLGCAHRPSIKEKMRLQGIKPDTIKFHGFPEMFMRGELYQQLKQYLERIDMDSSLLWPLLFMWWIKQLQDWSGYHLYHPEWRRLRVFPLIERLKALTPKI